MGKQYQSGTACEFSVETEALNRALGRVNTLLNVDGIPIQDQLVVFDAQKSGTLVLSAGYDGTYVRLEIEASVKRSGFFVTNIAIPWLSYGSKKVTFIHEPKKRAVSYSARIKGHFVTTGSRDRVEKHAAKRPKGYVSLPYSTLYRVTNTALFNADTLNDNPDVLLLAEVSKLDTPVDADGSPIKRKKDRDKKKDKPLTHKLRMVVYDRHRAAICEEPCRAKGPFGPKSFGSSHMWAFLQQCPTEQRKGNVVLGMTDEVVYAEVPGLVAVSPLIEETIVDMTQKFLPNYRDDDALFRFTLSTEKSHDAVAAVLSVRGGPRSKLTASSDENESRLMLQLRGKTLRMGVKSDLGRGAVAVKCEDAVGGGKTVVTGTYLMEAMSLVDPAIVEYTVWPTMIRQVARGRFKTEHYFATLWQRK